MTEPSASGFSTYNEAEIERLRCRRARTAAVVLTLAATFAPGSVGAQSAENVAVVINDNSADSQKVGQAYAAARSIPESNVFHIRTSVEETVDRDVYVRTIEGPLGNAIARARLQDQILYLVLTRGVPLRVAGTPGQSGTVSSVDSELTLLYRRMTGRIERPEGPVVNPYFLAERDLAEARRFTHRDYDIFLVSRLDGFTLDEALALIDRGVSAKSDTSNKIVLDQRAAAGNRMGDDWLAAASKRLADGGLGDQVVLETTGKPARGIAQVLGYFSWGSTDPQNRARTSGLRFAPGALAAGFVGSDARTFREPPIAWVPTGDPVNRATWYAGSPESLTGDLIRDGVTGAVGYIAQPFLIGTVRPQVLFPAYVAGFNLVESFYLAMPFVSWQAVVIGDPLCAPFSREALAPSDIEDAVDDVTELPGFFSMRRLGIATSVAPPGTSESAVAQTIRAEGLVARGDRMAAREALDRAIEAAPNFGAAWTQRAVLDEAAGRHDEAIEAYEKILEIDPNHIIALNNLAYALAVHRKTPSEGLPYARRAAAAAPSNATVLDTLAWIQHLLGDSAGAAKVMAQLVKGNTLNPDIRLHAAVVFAAIGQSAIAKNQLAIALKLNPALAGSAEVKQLQAELAKAK